MDQLTAHAPSDSSSPSSSPYAIDVHPNAQCLQIDLNHENRQKIATKPIHALAEFLHRHGVRQNHIIAVDSPLRPELPTLWLAAQQLHAITLFFPTDLSKAQQREAIQNADDQNHALTCIITAHPIEHLLDILPPSSAVPRLVIPLHPNATLSIENNLKNTLENNLENNLEIVPFDRIIQTPIASENNDLESQKTNPIQTAPPTANASLSSDDNAAVSPKTPTGSPIIAMTYSQGAHQPPRQIQLSASFLRAQARDIKQILALHTDSRIFFDLSSIQTITLSVLTAALSAGATFIVPTNDLAILHILQQSQSDIAFIRPHQLCALVDHIQKDIPKNHPIRAHYQKLSLKLLKLRKRHHLPLNWQKKWIEFACLNPWRERFCPKLKTVISYGNHFKTHSAECLNLLDIDVMNAFSTADAGIVHLHTFNGNGNFLPSVQHEIRNGILYVKTDDSDFIDTHDLIVQDARNGLCSLSNFSVTLDNGKIIDVSPLRQILKRLPIIDEVFIFGDNRPFLSALIYLDPHSLQSFANARKLPELPFDKLAQSPDIYAHIKAAVDLLNHSRPPLENIRKFALIPTPLDHDPVVLSPCRRARFTEIENFYKNLIHSFYDNFF